jgi:uncharacterized protein YcbX
MRLKENVGSVIALWRYPVKSMLGEELNFSEITEYGLVGDRLYALVDAADGKIASAKNPRKWPSMFDFRAVLADSPRISTHLPAVRITLHDGGVVDSRQPDIDLVLSKALTREVRLQSRSPGLGVTTSEEYNTGDQDNAAMDTITEFTLPEGTFFDTGIVHLLTTATIDRLSSLYPEGRVEVRRFRPNIVIETVRKESDFVENSWVGRVLAVGDSVRLILTALCGRCVMTTLAQADLPYDRGILRAAVQHNHSKVGIYACVLEGGTVRRGDSITLE